MECFYPKQEEVIFPVGIMDEYFLLSDFVLNFFFFKNQKLSLYSYIPTGNNLSWRVEKLLPGQ